MAILIENYLPGVRDNGGLASNEPVAFGSTLSVTGATTFGGSVTFGTSPTFTNGRLLNVVSQTTSATLTIGQSASTILLNSGTGMLITLPAPTVGAVYEFVVAKTPTSGSNAIVTNNTSAVFMYGALVNAQLSAASAATFIADGTTHVAIRMNNSTSGGSVGTFIKVVATSTTQWAVSGQLAGAAGAVITPFATG